MLVVNSRLNSVVYAYSLPDLKLLGSTEVGRAPDWVTLTPDSKRAYVANAQSNSVSVIDLQAMKELTRIPVGQVPKRNITALLPYGSTVASVCKGTTLDCDSLIP